MPKTGIAELTDCLAAVPIFHGVGPLALKRLAETARRKEVTRRQCFFIEGEDARHFFLLLAGRVKIAQQTMDGAQFVLNLVAPNEPFGDFNGARGRRYSATAEAVQDAVALVWPAINIRRALELYPPLALNTLDFVAARHDDLREHLRQLVTERVEPRVARALLRLTNSAVSRSDGVIELAFPISRQEIAEMSATTLFTVSRVLRRWEREGFVRVGRQRVVITKPAALEAVATQRWNGVAEGRTRRTTDAAS
jgi:CRP-like cAMP-binding protein